MTAAPRVPDAVETVLLVLAKARAKQFFSRPWEELHEAWRLKFYGEVEKEFKTALPAAGLTLRAEGEVAILKAAEDIAVHFDHGGAVRRDMKTEDLLYALFRACRPSKTQYRPRGAGRQE